jgi:hypothetical protein
MGVQIVVVNEKNKPKHKINWWLTDQEFLSKSNFPDLYYFETLCNYVANMVKNIPIPVCTSYDTKNKAIYFSVGKIKKGFKIDTNITYYDYLTIVKRWLIKFYPKYEIEREIERELTEDEMTEKAKQGMNLNDIIQFRKKEVIKEIGYIEKITMLKDEFILNVNGERQVRFSGSAMSPMSLSTFMDKLKLLQNNKKKYEFIMQNSLLIKKLYTSDKQEISIVYSGKQMLNFFIINYPDLQKEDLVELQPFLYKWGIFKIKFESMSLKNDCLNYYNEQKAKEVK